MDGDKELNITEAEAELYDRQIRLWGLDAQKRLRAARVLLVGVGGLGAEVAKNIVLSGIKSLTLLDDAQVSEEDFCNQFLISRSDVGKNRALSSLQHTQQLNPMVAVTADTEKVTDKSDGYFTNFDVICATCCSADSITRINDICHQNNIMFYAADVFGYYGYMFADLNDHEYAEDVEKKIEESDEPPAKKTKTDKEMVTVKKTKNFCRFKSALSVDWSSKEAKVIKRTPSAYFILRVLLAFHNQHGRSPKVTSLKEDKVDLLKLRETLLEELKVDQSVLAENFAEACFAQLSPVCAVTGGILGQEIIKAVSQRDPPHNNFFFYNGIDGSGLVDKIGG